MPRFVASLLLLTLLSPARADEVSRTLTPGRESEVVRIIAPHRPGTEVAKGWVLDAIRIEPHAIQLVLASGALPRVTLAMRPDSARGTVVEVRPDETKLPEGARAAVAALRSVLLAQADAGFWKKITASAESPKKRGVPGGLAWALTLFAIVGIGLLDGGRRSSFRLAVIAVVLAALPLLAWWMGERGDLPSQAGAWDPVLRDAEHRLVQLALVAAIGTALVALVSSLSQVRRAPSATLVSWVDAGAVLFWSLFVRLELAAPNLLTPGGAGWARLVEYGRGDGALSVIVSLVGAGGSVSEALAVPAVLGALAAPALALTGRALGLSRWAALLSGLAIASWPLHAALSASDLLVESMVALLVASIGLVAAAVPRESTALFAAGAALAGFAIWGRPELLVVGLPLVVLAWQFPRAFWLRPGAAGAVVWLGGIALVRLALMPARETSFAAPWLGLPWGEWLGTAAILPWWLWLPVPLGLVVAPPLARRVIIAGLVAGLVPVHLTPILKDPSETFLDFFLASAFAWPFVLLLSGTGLAAVARLVRLLLARRIAAAQVRGSVAASAPYVLLALAVLATPLLQREYLSSRYAPAVDENLFRVALKDVPRDCVVVVPDEKDTSDAVVRRYRDLAREASQGAWDDASVKVVGLSRLLAATPAGAEATAGLAALGAPSKCLHFFEGTHCHVKTTGAPSPACAEAMERWIFRPLWIRSVDDRSPRLVSRPRHEEHLRTPALQLRLSTYEGKRTPRPEGWDEPRQGVGPLHLHEH